MPLELCSCVVPHRKNGLASHVCRFHRLHRSTMEGMVGCVNAQSKCMCECGAWQEWRANPHNDGFSPIKLHAPRLTPDSLGSSFLSTWSSFLYPKELRITRVISPNLSLLEKSIIIFPW
jgi:hypothetical protein